MSTTARKRCAIYTRKSSEEGLDQEFNSLDAQREACEAYIASQAGLEWSLVATRYDDGGFSGGNLGRPALQRLVADVETGRVDIVVVYKIDRLTRALADFAKLVETFDRVDASFVSVTQQFNTTTSMGRLTLNVLLSFAQFEREVTAERIRDKISASKAKGMWMGGLPPLGYDARERQLVANDTEAGTVRKLFRSYLALGSIRALTAEVSHLGILTKRRLRRDGTERGGKPFSRGHLSALLRNPIYCGKIRHHGKLHEGRHSPIIDAGTWDAVQARLDAKAPARQSPRNHGSVHLLTGLLFDETGDRLSPSHANMQGRRYRYYISHRLMQTRRKDGDGWRLPAREVERLVLDRVRLLLESQAELLHLTLLRAMSSADIRCFVKRAKLLSDQLNAASPPEMRQALNTILLRVVVHPGGVRLHIAKEKLTAYLLQTPVPDEMEQSSPELRTIEISAGMQRRGVEAKMVITNGASPGPVDQNLLLLIARTRAYLDHLTIGSCSSVEAVAIREQTCASEVSRILPLAFLAPDIVTAISTGLHPAALTAERLKRTTPLPAHWAEQRKMLGFASQA